jgi:hypothetical protein
MSAVLTIRSFSAAIVNAIPLSLETTLAYVEAAGWLYMSSYTLETSASGPV